MFRYELEQAVGRENVISTKEEIRENSIDFYWVTHMWKEKGEPLTLPYFIVRPATTEETSNVMKICNRYKVPVVPRGGGSGSAGGAATFYGGIILDVTRMDKII